MYAAAFSKDRQARDLAKQRADEAATAAEFEQRIAAIPDSAVDHDPGIQEIAAQLTAVESELHAIGQAQAEIDKHSAVPKRIAELDQEIAQKVATVRQVELAAVLDGDLSAASAMEGRAHLRDLEDQHAALSSGWTQYLGTISIDISPERVAELTARRKDAAARLARTRRRLKVAVLEDRYAPTGQLRQMGVHRDDIADGYTSRNTSARRRAERRQLSPVASADS